MMQETLTYAIYQRSTLEPTELIVLGEGFTTLKQTKKIVAELSKHEHPIEQIVVARIHRTEYRAPDLGFK